MNNCYMNCNLSHATKLTSIIFDQSEVKTKLCPEYSPTSSVLSKTLLVEHHVESALILVSKCMLFNASNCETNAKACFLPDEYFGFYAVTIC